MRSVALLAALGLIVYATTCQRSEPLHPYLFPEFDRVVFQVRTSQEDKRSEVSSEYHGNLRDAFSAIRRDSNPVKWQTFGEEILFYKGTSEVLAIRIFRDPKGIGAFSVDGQYFRGYSLDRLKSVLPMRRFSTPP